MEIYINRTANAPYQETPIVKIFPYKVWIILIFYFLTFPFMISEENRIGDLNTAHDRMQEMADDAMEAPAEYNIDNDFLPF